MLAARVTVLLWMVLTHLGAAGRRVPGSANSNSGEENQMELRYQISEELPERSFVGDVLRDSDMERRHDPSTINQLKFRFLAPSSMAFEVDENNGIINTNGRIDRDGICANKKKCEVKLDVVALVPEPMTFIEIIKVIIEILDVNDNWPFFTDTDITHEILESAVRGSSFVIPTAIDPDSGPFAVQTYHLEPKTSKFKLDVQKKLDGSTDLRLVLQEQLDHERRDSYKFKVVAIDGGNPAKSGTLNLNVVVHDTNDNSPRFQNNTYECTIPENLEIGSVIKRVNARDKDSGLYGQVLYSFSPRTQRAYGQLFGIKNTTGDIFIKGVVDYEKNHVYHLVVTAHDRGPDSLPADATVIVQVLDTNDNAPEVTVNTLSEADTSTAEVLENEDVGTFVAHLIVSDPDTGVNGQFECHLSSSKFSLQKLYDTEYKITTRAKLDREEIPEYNLAITCQDEGREPQVSVKHLRAIVQDMNDNAPIFSKPRYVATIVENNYIAAFVVQVNATDRDSGDNARIMYQLQHDALEHFHIDPKHGAVTARSVFDRERSAEMKFLVYAVDHGFPAQSGSALIVVHVEDMNDENPRFSRQHYSFSVPENAPPPTDVGAVHAEDRDSNEHNEFRFSFLPDREVARTFSIDPHTGVIQTKVVLDREEKGLYHVPVAVIDTANPPMSSTTVVDVHVTDENDNTPVFEFPTELNNTIQISNLLPRGYLFARVQAVDQDIGPNGNVSYSLVTGTGRMLFGIDAATGALIVKTDLTKLDYREFDLTIKAEDQGPQPRHALSHVVNIAVNSSIPFSMKVESPKEPLLSGHNFTIVVCLGTLSGVVMVILCVTVISIRRQEARRRNHKYNCRMEALKILHTTREQTKDCDDNISVTKGLSNGSCSSVEIDRHRKEVSFRFDSIDDGEFPDGSPEKKKASWLSPRSQRKSRHEAIAGVLAEPDVTAVHHYAGPREMETAIGRDIRRVTHTLGASASPTSTLTRVRNDGPAAVVTGIPEGCVVPRTPYQRQALQTGSSRLPQRTSVPAHTNHKYTPVHTSEAETHQLLEMLRRADHDTDSAYSGEGSNTDSGRGPSEEGEHHHRVIGSQHSVHSLPRYPSSSKPEHKPYSMMPSLSEHNFTSFAHPPVQFHTFSTPKRGTFGDGSVQPSDTEFKLAQNGFASPDQIDVNSERNQTGPVRSNGEYIHVSPSKANYHSANSQPQQTGPDLCSTFRKPDHEKACGCPDLSAGCAGHQADSGGALQQSSNYNGRLDGFPASSQTAQHFNQDSTNSLSCHGSGIKPAFSDFDCSGDYPVSGVTEPEAARRTSNPGITAAPEPGAGARTYSTDPHKICTQIDELFFKNVTV